MVYDVAGPPIATRHNNDNWTCTAYDARGRATSVAVPAQPAPLSSAARTVTYAYARLIGSGPNFDPRISTVADATAGTSAITTTIDLLAHGYAVTTHRSQGLTVEATHELEDGGGRELSYVRLSRARGATTAYTVADDMEMAAEDLRRAWSNETRQRWAIDRAPSGPRTPDFGLGQPAA